LAAKNQMPEQSTESAVQMQGAGRLKKWLPHAICVGLAVLVWAVFGQTRGFEFVNYDDPLTVAQNTEVQKGLSFGGIIWAFTHSQVGHWDPVTTIFHMAVCQFFGLQAGWHHLGNFLPHSAAAILLFPVLCQKTGARRRSAFVATVFAVHPPARRIRRVGHRAPRRGLESEAVVFLVRADPEPRHHFFSRRPSAR
jgi:hypothetical protein